MPHVRSRFVIAVALGLTAVLAAGPATAQKVNGGTFHDEGSFTDTRFCGVRGLVVDGSFTVDGRFLERLQGRDSVFYGMDNSRTEVVYTRRCHRTGRHRHPAPHHEQGPQDHQQRRRHPHDHPAPHRW